MKAATKRGWAAWVVLSAGSMMLNSPMFSQDIKLEQKKGIIQDNKERNKIFGNITEIKLDDKGVFFQNIQKALLFDNKIFILDSGLNQISVVDEKGNGLYSIGKPGQGPGDLEYPADFTISESGKIYVVNHRAKRLEVFSSGGDFIRRINLNIPQDILYSQPWQVLVDPGESLYVSYMLSTHLIDSYSENGEFIRTLAIRDDPIKIPGKNIGNCSQIAFLNDNKLLHFNRFTGVFTIMSLEGNVEKIFSAYDKNNQTQVKRIMNEFTGDNKNYPYSRSAVFLNWSNFWIDADECIHVLLLLKEKNERQEIFCFSMNGDFLYKTTVPVSIDNMINKAHFSGNKYLFVTTANELFFSIKEE